MIIRALILVLALAAPALAADPPAVERVTTAIPFPRGLAMVDGDLYVLARGRVRGAGGVTAEVEDRAGTIFVVEPDVTEPLSAAPVGDAVRTNGRIFAEPTEPPFKLWDRSADPPESDRRTDRPYCTLRFHPPSGSFYVCAFSGIDKARSPSDPVAFSKNDTDAVLRYDRRTGRWHEVECRGPLDGPDNCLALGRRLYVVSKDNSRLVRYDLGALERTPDARPPAGEVVPVPNPATATLEGHSALAFRDGWLYVGTRTSSVIVRIRLDDALLPVEPIAPQPVARFDPYDPVTHASANITDMDFDDEGRLYVISAEPARVYRFTPDPDRVFDARDGAEPPWIDLAAATGNPGMKSENVLHHDGWLYVASGNGYAHQDGAWGTVYRVAVD